MLQRLELNAHDHFDNWGPIETWQMRIHCLDSCVLEMLADAEGSTTI